MFILFSLVANAANVNVNCNLPGPFGKINTALKFLNPSGPNTITVTGTCKENLFIQGFDRLTLVASPGAAITDASGGQQWAVIFIKDSRRVSIQGFTISGGNVGVRCEDYSLCRFSGNTITGTAQRGVDLNDSEVSFAGDIIQNNTGQGIFAQGSHITAMNIALNANQTGLTLFTGALVGAGWTVSNNTGDGIFVGASNFQLIDSSVSSNGWNGINTSDLSDLSLVNLTVGGNRYDGVNIGNTSVGWFSGGSYFGSGFFDISCAGPYAFANNITGIQITTNCPVPQAAAAQAK